MVNNGQLVPTSSEWGTPILVVPKEGKEEYRIV